MELMVGEMTLRTGMKKKKRNNPATGFTLLELAIVTLIAGIIAALVIPSFGPLAATTGIKSASRMITATLNYAHQRAIMGASNYRVIFDLDDDTFWLMQEKDALGNPGYYTRLSLPLGKTRKLPERIAFQAADTPRRTEQVKGTAYVTFFANGSCEPLYLRLSNGRGTTYTLVTKPRTGRTKLYLVEVKKEDEEPW